MFFDIFICTLNGCITNIKVVCFRIGSYRLFDMAGYAVIRCRCDINFFDAVVQAVVEIVFRKACAAVKYQRTFDNSSDFFQAVNAKLRLLRIVAMCCADSDLPWLQKGP